MEMLEAIGLGSAEELFDSIPQNLRLQRQLNTPAALSEIELLDRFEQMGARNAGARRVSFKGAGAYSHYIPTIVDHILTRSECLHALPARDFAGYAANYFRVSNARVPVDGYGSGECVDVRRFDRAGGSGVDG